MGNLIKFEHLEDEKKLIVYNWARDSIDSGMKQQISKSSYTAFVTALHGGAEFSMDEIWETLPVSTRQHFEHASDIMLHLDDEIGKLEELLDDEAEDNEERPPVPGDPFRPTCVEENDGEG